MSRSLLHISKLEDFKVFLSAHGIKHRPGRGTYQVLQVCKDGSHWNCVYRREKMPEHFTTDRHLDKLVLKFVRAQKQLATELAQPEQAPAAEKTFAGVQPDATQAKPGIDWALLRAQKGGLIAMAHDEDRLTTEIAILDGVIGLIDHLQDQAVADGKASQLEVFGEPEMLDDESSACPTCGEDGGTSCGALHCAY